MLMQNQCGDVTMRVMEYESQRAQVRVVSVVWLALHLCTTGAEGRYGKEAAEGARA